MNIPIIPINVPISDPKGVLTREWQSFFSNLILALQGHLSSDQGLQVPSLSELKIHQLEEQLLKSSKNLTNFSPKIIFNRDKNQYMFNLNGHFKALLFTQGDT